MKSTLSTEKLSNLVKSPLNVRESKGSERKIDEVAASILSQGLIHPLAVHAVGKPRGKAGVLAGQIRWKALLRLQEKGAAFDFDNIPVNRFSGTDAELRELSLHENMERQAMSAPETYLAFREIRDSDPTVTAAQLAERFGFEEARVARIMRLANLAPAILDDYAAGKLTDAQAHAYAATEDQVLQLKVRAQLEKAAYPHEKGPQEIKKALDVDDRDLTKLLRYVGRPAYEAEGGIFEPDIFSADPYIGRIMNGPLLGQLAARKRIADMDSFVHRLERNGRSLGENWGQRDLLFDWADAPPQIKEYGYLRTDSELAIPHPKLGKLGPEEEARAAQLKDSIIELTAAISRATGDDDAEALEEQRDRLGAALAEIDAMRTIVLPKKGAVVGICQIDVDGAFQVSLYYASRKEKGIAAPVGASAKGASRPEPTPGERERARLGLSKDNAQVLMLIRRDMIREELIQSATQGSSLALDFLLFAQARTILRPKPSYDGFWYIGGAQGIADVPKDDDGSKKLREAIAYRPERKRYKAHLDAMKRLPWVSQPDAVVAFGEFCAAGPKMRLQAAAIVASHLIVGSEDFFSDGRTPRMVRELANHIEQEPGFGRWRDAVELDANFFELFSHKARMALLDSWGAGERAKNLRAGETADFCRRVANLDEADAELLGFHPDDVSEVLGWLPDLIETAPVEPLASEESAATGTSTDEDDDPDDQFMTGDDDTGEFEEAAE